MRAQEFIVESRIPDIVYHGTASANLTNIMKHGIKPKLNRYTYANRHHGGGIDTGLKLKPGERRSDFETISTSVNFDNSLEYARLGGSTGSGSPGVVVAFKPLPSDNFEATGMPGEVIFRNAISPDRLQIVWPERLVGRERELAQRAEQKKQFGASKTEQIKTINRQLKAAGSLIRIKSTNANTARIAVWFMDPEDPVQVGNTNIDDQNFAVFLKRELANPAPNKERYYGRTNWLNEFAPEGFDQYSLYTGDGISSHLIDRFSSLKAAKEEVESIWDADPEARLSIWFVKNLNDETVWYYDPQEIADAPRWHFKKFDDLDEMAGSIHVGISQYLADKGYQYLGGGIDKQAYSEPSTGQVLIVFGYRKGQKDFSPDQRMFIDWINYCNKNRANPHLPRFSGFESFQFHGKNYIQARMEALQELPEEIGFLVNNIADAVKKTRAKNYDEAFHNIAMWSTHDSYEGDNPEQYDIKTVIRYLGGKKQAIGLLQTVNAVAKFGKKHGFNIDLHGGNYMQRPNGTIVVNDPFVLWINGR